MQTAEQKERARLRATEWRKNNPDRAKAQRAIQHAKRKERWDEFLADERRRYQERRDIILSRQAKRRQVNGDRVREIQRNHYRRNPHKAVANCAARKAKMLRATPAWADLTAIEAMYAEARRLTQETGIPHEVDHIDPLQGRSVCGLHVIENLRIVTRTENRRKGYKCLS